MQGRFSSDENFVGYVMGNSFELRNKGNYLQMDVNGLLGHVCDMKRL